MVNELKAIPQIRSTQVAVDPAVAPVCASGFMVLAAQGMVIQSVEHEVPTVVPAVLVMLNDCDGVLTELQQKSSKISHKDGNKKFHEKSFDQKNRLTVLPFWRLQEVGVNFKISV